MEISKSDFVSINHEEAWLFFYSAFNSIESMRAYRHIINECMCRRKSNFESILRGEMEIPDSERKSFPPGNLIEIDGVNISISFLLTRFTQDFFQAARNSFDYMSQVIASLYCTELNLKKPDMSLLMDVSKKITVNEIRTFLDSISSSDTYKYMCDYNNVVKHNYDLGLSLSIRADSLDTIGKIPAFSKGSRGEIHSYEEKELIDQMRITHQFAIDCFGEIIGIIWPEKKTMLREE